MSHSLSIICSDEPRNGKTLFSRLTTDLLALAGEQGFRVFDTDFPVGDLAGFYPENAQIVDFAQTQGQIQIFDTILAEPDFDYVIDLDSGLLTSFFKLFSDIRFDFEARRQRIDVEVFYILDRKVSSVSNALLISGKCGIARFTPVRNEALGNILAIPQAVAIYSDIKRYREIVLPRLSVNCLNYIEQSDFSFTDFVVSNGKDTPAEFEFELWAFLEAVYNQRDKIST